MQVGGVETPRGGEGARRVQGRVAVLRRDTIGAFLSPSRLYSPVISAEHSLGAGRQNVKHEAAVEGITPGQKKMGAYFEHLRCESVLCRMRMGGQP